jgi:D-beta-D-heptose 7-phosphate kinase/D-beta-D-heptose 1-phosphate adenosyltransferase
MARNGDLLSQIDRLRTARVLCIGDVMLDHYVYGEVDRLSPEAPVPVLAIDSETRSLGGAGTVLRNLAALGAGMSFVSVVGNDDTGREVQHLLAELAGAEIHVLVQPERMTTVKTRFIAVNQHLLRADRESAIPLGPYIRDDFLRLVRELVTSHTVVAIADYAKGVLADGVALEIIKTAQEAGARVVVEPKGGDPIRYRGADVLVPTRRELAQSTGMPVGSTEEVVAAAQASIERCGFGAVFVALGPAEVILVKRRASADAVAPMLRAPSGEAYDASGAEDAALAVLAAGFGAGLTLGDAAALANLALGIVGGKAGTAIVSAGELAAAVASDSAGRVRVRADPGRLAGRAGGAAAPPPRARSAR